jgi:hypothetical protein
MPRQMPRFDNALHDNALTAVSIVGAGELSRHSGAPAIRKEWKLARLEALYELAYLRVFAAWESYLEAIFYRSLCGYASAAGQEKLIAGGYYLSLADAEAAVLGGQSYVLWHSPQKVITRCQAHFIPSTSGGGPCALESTVASNLARLEHLAATRHRIVHNQADAKNKFDAATLHLAGRTYAASRPGKFLRDYHPSRTPQQRWLEVAVTELSSLMAQMV